MDFKDEKQLKKLKNIFELSLILDDSINFNWDEGMSGYYQLALSNIVTEKFTEFFTLRYATTSIYPDTSWFKVRARTANVYTKRRNRTYVKQVVKVTCSIHFLNIILQKIGIQFLKRI